MRCHCRSGLCLVSGKTLSLTVCNRDRIAWPRSNPGLHNAAPRKDGLRRAEVARLHKRSGRARAPRAPRAAEPASIPIPAEASYYFLQLHPLMLDQPTASTRRPVFLRDTTSAPTGYRACLHAGAAHGQILASPCALAFGLVVHARQQRDGAHRAAYRESPTMRMPPRTRRCSAPMTCVRDRATSRARLVGSCAPAVVSTPMPVPMPAPEVMQQPTAPSTCRLLRPRTPPAPSSSAPTTSFASSLLPGWLPLPKSSNTAPPSHESAAGHGPINCLLSAATRVARVVVPLLAPQLR